MTCPKCAELHDIEDLTRPYGVRTCSACGREIKVAPTLGAHGFGIVIPEGDRFVLPPGSIKISANPIDSPSYLTRPGLAWFAQLVFIGSFGNTSDDVMEYIIGERAESEAMLKECSLLKGLDVDNEDDWPKINERL